MRSQDRVSAVERLRSLPPVFRAGDLSLRFGWSSDEAAQYLLRWKRRDFVKATGPRSGVYFNLLRESSSPDTRREEVIATLLPSALVAGGTALYEAGWTTQIPSRLETVALRRRTYPKLNGVAVYPRGAGWYRLAHDWLQFPEDKQHLPRIDAAFALADALKFQDGWVPDPDDVEFATAQDQLRFLKACEVLKVSLGKEWRSAAKFELAQTAV